MSAMKNLLMLVEAVKAHEDQGRLPQGDPGYGLVGGDMADYVTRYVVTHIGTNGERRMTAPARQGRYTHDTPEEAAQEMRDILNVEVNGNDIPGVFGEQAVGTFEVRPINCWPNTHDPASQPLEVD